MGSKKKIDGWQKVVDHVNDTWKKKKGVDYNYPWEGKAIQDLAHVARNFQPWGAMALWDIYLEEADDWTKRQGFAVGVFVRSLPRLTDRAWKARARAYEQALFPAQLHPKTEEAMSLFGKKFEPKKRRQNKSRLQWLKEKANK